MFRVAQMSAREFEALCHALLEAEGFEVHRLVGAADRGIDFLVKREQTTWVVQCKHRVGAARLDKTLLELLRHRKRTGADRALFITSTRVAGSERDSELAELDIEIWDSSEVQRLLEAHPELAAISAAPAAAFQEPRVFYEFSGTWRVL